MTGSVALQPAKLGDVPVGEDLTCLVTGCCIRWSWKTFIPLVSPKIEINYSCVVLVTQLWVDMLDCLLQNLPVSLITSDQWCFFPLMVIWSWLCWTLKMRFFLLWTVNQSFVQLGPRVLHRRLCSGALGAKHRPHDCLCCVLCKKVTVVYLLWWKCLDWVPGWYVQSQQCLGMNRLWNWCCF